MEYKKYTVEELIDLKMIEKPIDGNHGNKHPKNSDFIKEGIPFIMASNINNGKVNYKNCNFISPEQRKKLDKGFAKPGDVLLTHKATIGLTAVVDDTYKEIVLTPQVTYYRVKSGINNMYLKYYFDSEYFQNILKNWSGSGSTRAYLGIIAQQKLPIILPEYKIQCKIAKILQNIDKKIVLNNKLNDNLHELMKLKFNLWLENLQEYNVLNLSEIANYTNGLAMQKFRPKEGEESLPVIKIKEMNSGVNEDTERCSINIKDNVKIFNGDVLFAWSGTLCMTIWGKGKAGLNQHIFKVTSDKYPKWFYYFWTQRHLNKFIQIAQEKATTMGHIKKTELNLATVIIPIEKELTRMDKIMKPMLKKYISNIIQNETLVKLRDTLLHKLINGEIDLENIEI